jgi:UDP-N-acetylglucosamine 2-epimerase (non-hydrolysing)
LERNPVERLRSNEHLLLLVRKLMKKVMAIFGTRPEAIKLAPVLQRLKTNNSLWECTICVTGQHREMLDQALRMFAIQPDYDLNIMRKEQDLFDVTAHALVGIGEVLRREKPQLVLVQGDTTTAFIAALAAFYLKTSIGHIEAGLRTYQKYSPFPEEKNRHLLSALVDYHFAPTEWAKSNLLREGINQENIWVTGNTGIDALLYVKKHLEERQAQDYWTRYFKEKYDLDFRGNHGRVLLVTGHRRENFGQPLENICFALKRIAEQRKDITIVYPVHLNPNVQRQVKVILNGKPNIRLIEPLEYQPFVFLMTHSYLILTDSGGIQEEAPALGKPVLVMRSSTERPEGIKAGTSRLVGTEGQTIENGVLELLDNRSQYETMARVSNPYGDGQASERIINVIRQHLAD